MMPKTRQSAQGLSSNRIWRGTAKMEDSLCDLLLISVQGHKREINYRFRIQLQLTVFSVYTSPLHTLATEVVLHL